MKLSGAGVTLFFSLCLILTLKVSSGRSNDAIVETQEYGDPCSDAERCRTRFGTIFCSPQDATCSCVDPDSMVWDEQEEVCVSKFGGMCYTRPLKNRNIRNCVTGATCVGVSKKSVFGTCQEGLEEEEQDVEEQEEGEEQKEDKPVQVAMPVEVETKDEEIYETTETDTNTDEPETSTSPPEETSTPEVIQPGPQTSTPGEPEPGISTSTPEGPEPETSTSTPGGPEPEPTTSTPGGPEPEPTTSTSAATVPSTVPPPTGPIIDQPCGEDLGPCSVEDAVCNSNNLCVCRDDFTPENDNTMCKIRALRSCDPDAPDICITNSTCSATSRSCECKENRVPKNSGSHCALGINQICEVTDDCLEHADCTNDGPSPTRRCTCRDGYPASEDNLRCSADKMFFNISSIGLALVVIMFANKL